MKTAELIKELANELILNADCYGAYIDEVRAMQAKTLEEFFAQIEPINEKYPTVDFKRMGFLYCFLIREISEDEATSEAVNDHEKKELCQKNTQD